MEKWSITGNLKKVQVKINYQFRQPSQRKRQMIPWLKKTAHTGEVYQLAHRKEMKLRDDHGGLMNICQVSLPLYSVLDQSYLS